MADGSMLEQARAAHRNAVEMLYEGVCTVYEKQGVTDQGTKITRQQEMPIYESIACRLSFSKVMPVEKKAEGYQKAQVVKLFLAPEINIRPGSKIVVTQNKVTEVYRMSSVAAIYGTHQEIVLDVWEGWT